ncbi:MAG: DUF2339 domain-containing protein [Candidatus Moranbacteria bacterium]|nr:DUF2339 domain-containing protein [Candidatus Moranbacteria bacterium]NTW89610.1 DUF2339 domain-containing protein [Candidatus Moranbacteria bacterium]
MLFLVFVVGLIGFKVLLSRVQVLERKVTELEHSAPIGSRETARPVPVQSVPNAMPASSGGAPVTLARTAAQETIAPAASMSQPKKSEPVSIPESAGFMKTTLNRMESGSSEKGTLESNIGGKLFTGIGAIAVLLGVGFFFRYAIEVGIITEPVRVLLGILAGVALLVVGQVLMGKYARYSQILTGTGIGMLYLSLYFGYASYDLLSQAFAFVLMILVTVVGIALALRHDSVYLALFAQIGGFLTPLLVSDGGSATHQLFLYMLLLDAGMVVVAWKKLWMPLTLVSFIGTALLYSMWFSNSFGPSQAGVASIYASLFFIFFFAVSVLRQTRHHEPSEAKEAILVLLNAGYFLFIGLAILEQVRPELRGTFAFIFAALHGIAAFMFREYGERFRMFTKFLASISVVTLAIGIPIQFDRMYVTIGWAAQGAVLAYLGFALRSRLLRSFSLIAFLLVFLRLLSVDTFGIAASEPWLNGRMISLLFSVIAYGVAIFFFHKGKGDASPEESSSVSFLLLTGLFMTFVTGSAQSFGYHPAWVTILFWSVLAFGSAVVSFGLKNRVGRVFSLVLTMAILLGTVSWSGLLSASVSVGFPGSRILAAAFGLIVMAGIFFLYRTSEGEDRPEERDIATTLLLLEAYLLTVWVGSAEIDRVGPSFWIPLFAAAASTFAGWISSRFRESAVLGVNYAGLMISGIAAIFMNHDAAVAFSGMPILNARVLVFLVVILSMLLFRQLLRREGKNTRVWSVPARKALSFFLHALGFFLMNVEIYDALSPTLRPVSGAKTDSVRHAQSMRNAALSVAWSAYAIATLAYGIVRKSSAHRLAAMFLFGAAILKVFLYDAAGLDTFYRFVSYFSLGVLLLLAGYAYNRYRDRISEFVRDTGSSDVLKG